MNMKTTQRRWWISSLLVMAMMGIVSMDSLTDLGKEAVRLVRKNFHETNKMKNAFQVSSTVYEELSNETFVKVKFRMKQTNCKRREWKNPDCTPIKKIKRAFNCVGCFKFNSSGDLLKTGYQKCVRQSRANTKEVTEQRRKACSRLRDKKEKKEKKTVYDVGVYSFRR
ncbi:retinoic acid receptor responder protein 2-like isoform X2 [Eleutherodactylus coqui]|nr:hypothetical protein GDO78_017449 [Eleutherodactylus coqui]